MVLLIAAGLETLLAEAVGKLRMSVQAIHVHAYRCKLNSTCHTYALRNCPLPLLPVFQIRINCGNRVVRIHCVILLVCIGEIVINVFYIYLGEELNCDVGG